ncbi:hypothetical protein IEE91_04315 [Kocuria sp. cx-455]|nr:hypothetical protein [Kocuria sp. cx-455]
MAGGGVSRVRNTGAGAERAETGERRTIADPRRQLCGPNDRGPRDHGGSYSGRGVQTAVAGGHVQLVCYDLRVTDPARIRDGAEHGYPDAMLIKPNQIGTVTETFDAITTARKLGMTCMVSHRSGETADTFIADLVVGTGVGQIKSGAPARGERVAKYNRLTDIALNHPDLTYGLA